MPIMKEKKNHKSAIITLVEGFKNFLFLQTFFLFSSLSFFFQCTSYYLCGGGGGVKFSGPQIKYCRKYLTTFPLKHWTLKLSYMFSRKLCWKNLQGQNKNLFPCRRIRLGELSLHIQNWIILWCGTNVRVRHPAILNLRGINKKISYSFLLSL